MAAGVFAWQRACSPVRAVCVGEAAKWFGKAAAQGIAAGQHDLGASCEQGCGVAAGAAAAGKWHRFAAAQGDPDAVRALGPKEHL